MGAAAPDYAATPLDPPIPTAFCLDDVPNGSNLDPVYDQVIVLVAVCKT